MTPNTLRNRLKGYNKLRLLTISAENRNRQEEKVIKKCNKLLICSSKHGEIISKMLGYLGSTVFSNKPKGDGKIIIEENI